MSALSDNVTIIIRSVGERTEELCRELILAQELDPNNVVVVREAPFSAAMRRSFEIGIECGRPWTLCVDADVLLRVEAVAQIVQLAEHQPQNVCEIQGYILDKFFGGPRHGGGHLYRTALLPLALTKIPSEGVDIRPESYMLKLMDMQGYPRAVIPYLVGLHDFEQFNKDIFRKCLVHAHKHTKYADLFLSIWREHAPTDPDYRIALQGFAKGVEYTGKVLIDAQQDIYQQFDNKLQLNEKPPLPSDKYTLDSIEEIIANWVAPESYQIRFPTKFGLSPPTKKSLSSKEKVIKQMSDLGPIRIVPYSIGWFMRRMGNGLQSWANH